MPERRQVRERKVGEGSEGIVGKGIGILTVAWRIQVGLVDSSSRVVSFNPVDRLGSIVVELFTPYGSPGSLVKPPMQQNP